MRGGNWAQVWEAGGGAARHLGQRRAALLPAPRWRGSASAPPLPPPARPAPPLGGDSAPRGPTPRRHRRRGSVRRLSSMPGSPGRLIDLDQEYSAGASARTAAGGTPQVPLSAPRGRRALSSSAAAARDHRGPAPSARSAGLRPTAPRRPPGPPRPPPFWRRRRNRSLSLRNNLIFLILFFKNYYSSPLLRSGSLRELFQLSSLKSFPDKITFWVFFFLFSPPSLPRCCPEVLRGSVRSPNKAAWPWGVGWDQRPQ